MPCSQPRDSVSTSRSSQKVRLWLSLLPGATSSSCKPAKPEDCSKYMDDNVIVTLGARYLPPVIPCELSLFLCRPTTVTKIYCSSWNKKECFTHRFRRRETLNCNKLEDSIICRCPQPLSCVIPAMTAFLTVSSDKRSHVWNLMVRRNAQQRQPFKSWRFHLQATR